MDDDSRLPDEEDLMAGRSHGRILTRIWHDSDFIKVSAAGQRLYLLLLSQPGLGHAGVMALTRGRWAALCPDTSSSQVEEALQELHDCRFIVVDWDTEEVFIRTLLRNDGAFKMPQLWGIIQSEVLAVMSPLVRRALADELDRAPEGTDHRVLGVAATLAATLAGTPDATPSKGFRGGCPQGSPEPLPEPIAAPSRVRAHASPSPSPSPTPKGLTTLMERARSRTPTSTTARSKPKTLAPDSFEITPELRAWAHAKGVTANLDSETEKFLDHHAGKGTRFVDWTAAWRTWMRNSIEFGPRMNGGKTRPKTRHIPTWER